MTSIDKKVVIVTGASSGIGEATTRLLVERGAKVMLAARREEKLKKICDELGKNSSYCVTDISNHENVLEMAEETIKVFGKIDVLVNNAGISTKKHPLDPADKVDRYATINDKT